VRQKFIIWPKLSGVFSRLFIFLNLLINYESVLKNGL
jgi:hypothetical protein